MPLLALNCDDGRGDGNSIHTVLVVDDEPHIVRLIKVNLERAGYVVHTASDGVEAMEQIAAELPDLMILDVMMPRMDGEAVLRELRRQEETRQIPVIMLSQKAGRSDTFRGWAAGVDGYITKPFNPTDLVHLIARF